MFKIGDFSKFTRVSVKMLRHYDELGLLRPAFVDPESGYRYYLADQVPRLNRIIALKDLGFSLEQVAALLGDALAPEELRAMLERRRDEIAERIRAERRRMAQVETRLRLPEQDAGHAAYDVVLRPVAAQLVAAVRMRLPTPDASIAPLFDEAEAHAAAHRARAAASPLTIFHDAEYPEAGLDVEAAVPLARPIPPAGRVAVRELPGAPEMACVVYAGGYERTPEALHALLYWIAANGYVAAGPLREVYLRFGADNAHALGLPAVFLADEPARFVTEVQLPVAPREARVKR
ncbi:MAG TPA: MerR family transcriptional regulator [Roseiflexaceae bacterium]|nr:MerR family transcriptional regulator [Roseiflexaceae bacterium]